MGRKSTHTQRVWSSPTSGCEVGSGMSRCVQTVARKGFFCVRMVDGGAGGDWFKRRLVVWDRVGWSCVEGGIVGLVCGWGKVWFEGHGAVRVYV